MPQIHALLLGNGRYNDSSINPLPKVAQDVAAMQAVLTDPKIGRVLPDNVRAPLDLTLREAKRLISDFFSGKDKQDLLIFYYSGHGLRDREGRLYLAVQDTDKRYLHDEALPASFIAEKMSQSRAKLQIIILDCCHSGAFKPAPDAKAVDLTAVVLTASDASELAWEDDPNLPNALFTHHVIKGLQSPLTDQDGDGLISVDELYQYVQQQLASSRQKPQRLVPFGRYEQELIIAQSSHQSPHQIDPKLLQGHHFICYAGTDGDVAAFALAEQLRAQHCPVWLDVDDLQPFGHPREQQIKQAIETCLSLLFVVTPDSLLPESTCGAEWRKALSAKKPLVLLMTAQGLELPLPLQPRKQLDWRTPAREALVAYLAALNSPAGQVELLTQRLTEAELELKETKDSQQRARIKNDITELRRERARGEKAALDPTAAAAATQQSIAARLVLEQRPVDAPKPSLRVINPPPAAVPHYFQDRYRETELLVKFLADDNRRMACVIGRGGVGKTAVVTRLLRTLERGELPDKLSGTQPIQGIVYLSQVGSRRINLPNLFADVCRLLPTETAQRLEAIYREPQRPTADKVGALLAQITGLPLIVLLDNFEDLLAGYPTPALPLKGEGVETGHALSLPSDVGGIKGGRLDDRQIIDHELAEALQTILTWPYHSLKVILTSRLTVAGLPQPQRQFHLNLEGGLVSPYGETVLREMDADGTVGLQRADDATLAPICHFTRGYPRALEAFYGILAADRATTLREVLATLGQTPPEQVVEVLVGEAFQRLEATAQKVMQALAIYGRPVTATAVDYLLEPYLPTVDSQLHLNRLVNLQLVRKEEGLFYLHQVDRQFALSRIPTVETGHALSRAVGQSTAETGHALSLQSPPPFTPRALYHRAADYFKQTRRPRDTWKKLADLEPQLAEIELRMQAEDYNTAADVLLDIDFHYLLLWGYYRLMLQLHEGLQGKISEAWLKQNSVGNLGTAYRNMGQVQQAIICYEQALAMAREAKNKGGEGAWLGGLGLVYWDLGQTARAIEYLEQALTFAREIGNKHGEGAALGNLGGAYADLGQTARAIEYLEQALVIAREIGDKQGEGVWLGNLGNAYADIGQTARGIEYYEQALAIAREIGDKAGEGRHLGNLGNRYANLGQTARAIGFYEQALAIDREIGNKGGEETCLGNLGSAYSDLGQTARAIEFYEQALAIAREIGDKAGEGRHLGNLGIAYYDLGQTARAIEFYEQALVNAREIGDKEGEGRHLGNLGNRYSDLGQTVRAIEFYEQALAIDREIGNKQGEGIRLGNIGWVLIDEARYEEAILRLNESLKIAEEISSPFIGSHVNYRLALTYLLQSHDKVSNLIMVNEPALAEAWAAIEAARAYDVPQNNHNVSVLRGIIARWVAVGLVRPSFEEALGQAEVMLEQTPGLYEALDAKALALQGLGRAAEAQVAFQQARALNSAAGVVGRVERLWGWVRTGLPE